MRQRFKVILEWNEDDGGYTVTVQRCPDVLQKGIPLRKL